MCLNSVRKLSDANICQKSVSYKNVSENCLKCVRILSENCQMQVSVINISEKIWKSIRNVSDSAMIPRFGLFKALNIVSNKEQMRPFGLQIKTTDLHNSVLKSNFIFTSFLALSWRQKKCPFCTSHPIVNPVPFRLSQWSYTMCCLV